MARSHDSPDDDITHSLTQWIPFTWIYWRQQVETSLTRTIGLLRYIHRGDLKLQNKWWWHYVQSIKVKNTSTFNEINSYTGITVTVSILGLALKMPHEKMGHNFSSLSIFRTLQTKVQTSNVWIVIMLQLLIKLKSLMSLNFPDEHKRPWHNISVHRTVGILLKCKQIITGEERTLILIQDWEIILRQVRYL